MTPARGDDEECTADRESNPRDDRSSSGQFEPWYLCCGNPDAGEQHEQEADLGQAPPGLMSERHDEMHTSHLSALPPRAQ